MTSEPGAARSGGNGFPLPVIFAVVAVLIAIAAYVLFPSLFQGQRPLEGTLIIYTSEPWTAPSNETVQGFVSYTPSTAAVSYLLPPNDPLLALMVSDSISPDGEKFVALLPADESRSFPGALVSFSFTSKQPVLPIEEISGTVIGNFVWGLSGGMFAYTVGSSPPSQSLHLAPVFDDQPDYGSDTPLAFSPDGKKLLVREQLALGIISISNGFRTPVSGIADFASAPVERFAVSPDGSYLAAHSFMGVTVYTLDWENATLKALGSIEGASPVFNDRNQLLVRIPQGVGKAYQLTGRLVPLQTDIVLPEGARLIRWLSE